MRCHICDAPLSSISFNADHGDIDPCPACLEVIDNVFTDPVPDEEARERKELTPEEMLEAVETENY